MKSACAPGVREAYAVTQAISRELDDLTWAAYRVGDDAQRGAVDVIFDLATLSVDKVVARTSRWSGEVVERGVELSTGRGAELALDQARNNLEVFGLVRNVRARLRIEPGAPIDLHRLVDEAYGLGAYADLWSIEGLGHDYTVAQLERGVSERILVEGPAAGIPANSLTMMHAGLGLAFAERLLPRLNPCAPASEFRRFVGDYVSACDSNGRPGYRGASYESLGLVARTWHPQLMPGLDAALREVDPTLAGYFWHGAGRALYFLPTYIIPILSPWRAADREAPHELAHDNLYAGLAWAWTLVNMRQPGILAELLRQRGDTLRRSAPFANGVAAALVVAVDVTPDDPIVGAFASFVPDDAATAAAWNAVIAPAARAALSRYQPLLRVHKRLEVVFHYVDLAELVHRLEEGA